MECGGVKVIWWAVESNGKGKMGCFIFLLKRKRWWNYKMYACQGILSLDGVDAETKYGIGADDLYVYFDIARKKVRARFLRLHGCMRNSLWIRSRMNECEALNDIVIMYTYYTVQHVAKRSIMWKCEPWVWTYLNLDINGNWIGMMEINTVAVNKWQRWFARQFVRNREKRSLFLFLGSLTSAAAAPANEAGERLYVYYTNTYIIMWARRFALNQSRYYFWKHR